MIEKLINLFKVESAKQLIIVFLVFSITGSLSVFLGEPIINFLFQDGFENNLFFEDLSTCHTTPITCYTFGGRSTADKLLANPVRSGKKQP